MGTLPTPGVPGPRLQKEDVRLATSRPVLTGWSFYFYIHTSRFFSCPQEKLTEKGGLGSLPGAGGSQAVSLSWRCSWDRAIPRGTLPCRAAWGHPSWPGPRRLGDSRMLQELALCPEAGHSRGLAQPLPTRLGGPAYALLSPPDSSFQPHPAMPLTSEQTPEEPGRKERVGRTGWTGRCLPFLRKTTNCARALRTWLRTHSGAPARRLPLQAPVSSPVKWDPRLQG